MKRFLDNRDEKVEDALKAAGAGRVSVSVTPGLHWTLHR